MRHSSREAWPGRVAHFALDAASLRLSTYARADLARSLTVKFAETRTASLRPRSLTPALSRQAGEGGQDAALHGLGLGEDLGVREAHNGEALAGEPSFALPVVLGTVDMDRSVRFDHERLFVTKEVHDESADRRLPAELQAQKLPAAHESPEHPFGLRLLSAQRARRPRTCSSHPPPFGR